MHCTMVLAALESGKHVLTEARMAMDATEARVMLDASRQKPNLVTQIVPAPHTLRVDNTIKELIADGYLGDILSVDLAAHLGGFIDRAGPLHWRHDRDLSGYNIMVMGIWYEAMMRWVGPATSVSAVTRVNVTERRDESGARHIVTIPDHVELLCEMASGPVAHMCFSAVAGLAPADSIWLFGTEGTLKLDASDLTLYGGRRGDDRLAEIAVPPDKQGAWRVEEEFVNAIRGLEPVTHTSFEDGVRYMEFTEAVTLSARSGERVHL
jgi:predicted dehydrogenase